MNITAQRFNPLSIFITLVLLFVFVGCSESSTPQPARINATLPATNLPLSPTAVHEQKPSAQATGRPALIKPTATATQVRKTPAPSPTASVQPSPTAPQIDPVSYRSNGGTPVPLSPVALGLGNLTQLGKMAQWGKGTIQRITFSPDGHSLLAGSPFGVAVYSMDDFQQPIQWLPFDVPVYFRDMQISQDGTLIRLQSLQDCNCSTMDSKIFSLTEQKFMPADTSGDWVVSQRDQRGGYDELNIVSPDDKIRFEGGRGYLADGPNTEIFSGNFIDNQNDQWLFSLKDDQIYVHYEDYNQPEGCDLESFSMCGNVYTPLAMGAYRAEFSSAGRLLAILYRPPNLGNSEHFSLLRVYSAQDGSLIDTFGSFDQPVQDFAFQPGSDRLSVAFVNGSIQVWDLAQKKLLHQTWNFSPPVMNFAFSGDGRYLLIQYSDAVEVLRTSDGAVTGRYEASAIALSPKANLLALGSKDGGIQVEDLDERKTVSHMAGHTAIIYALAFSPDGQTLTSSSEDCTIRSWDAHTGQFQHYFEKAEVDAIGEGWTKSRIFVYYMNFVPGSNQLVGFGSWGTAASWNTNSGAKDYAIMSQPLEYYDGMKTLNPHFPQSFWVVPEESRFYINESAYDLKSGETAGGFIPPANMPEGCSADGPVSTDGTVRFTPGYGHLNGQICVLNAKDSSLLYRIPIFPQNGDSSTYIQQIFLSPDGTRLFAASLNGPVFIYQIQP